MIRGVVYFFLLVRINWFFLEEYNKKLIRTDRFFWKWQREPIFISLMYRLWVPAKLWNLQIFLPQTSWLFKRVDRESKAGQVEFRILTSQVAPEWQRPIGCLKLQVIFCKRATNYWTGFARDSGHEETFSKLPKVIQVQWKLQKQKDFYILINGSFNQNRLSLRWNVLGGFWHKWRRLLMTRWRWRRK